MRWIMECIGAAFTLPMSEHNVIQWAVEIYFRWIKGPTRPKPIEEDLQHFFQQIFLHFSLLFQVRKVSGSQDVQYHSTLCSQVLKILEMVGRELASSLETETWELLLKVLMGMVDGLLSTTVGSGQEGTLATELCTQLLQVIYLHFIKFRSFSKYGCDPTLVI